MLWTDKSKCEIFQKSMKNQTQAQSMVEEM